MPRSSPVIPYSAIKGSIDTALLERILMFLPSSVLIVMLAIPVSWISSRIAGVRTVSASATISPVTGSTTFSARTAPLTRAFKASFLLNL